MLLLAIGVEVTPVSASGSYVSPLRGRDARSEATKQSGGERACFVGSRLLSQWVNGVVDA
jgi:hypothetical protein